MKIKYSDSDARLHTKSNRVKEQQILFSEERFLPDELPSLTKLQPSWNLSAVFDECHNYIYANEGFLKDKIFHEMVKLIIMKMSDEQSGAEKVKFGITAGEYQDTIAGKSDNFSQRLQLLYQTVKSRSPLLLTDDCLKLQPQTLAYLAGRLQLISLTYTPGDVKGEAFQAFTYRHQRGGRGEFFTPHPIVRLAVRMLNPQCHDKIIDPACGSGGFLIEAIAHAKRCSEMSSTYIQKNIRGVEFNPDVALSASIRLAFEGGEGTEIYCANGLGEDDVLKEKYDIILTNPPFGSKGKIEERNILKNYLLARKWERTFNNEWKPTSTVLSGQSPDVLFIEKCLNMLKPGGRMAIVLPDGLLQNITNGHIRFWVRSQAQILATISIPQEAFIPYGTGIKTSLLLLQKFPATNISKCFMARINKIGYDVKGQMLYKRDERGIHIKGFDDQYIPDDDIEEIAVMFQEFISSRTDLDKAIAYTIPLQELGSRLDAEYYQPSDHRMIHSLKQSGSRPLGDIAEIVNETASFRSEANLEMCYIAISNVDYRTMQVVSQQIMKSQDAPSRASYRIRSGDIITATSGASTGTPKQATALITDEEDGAICSNGFAVIRNVHGVNPYFLLAYMRSEYYLCQVKRFMTGHAIPSISQEDLAKVLVPIPSAEQQGKIARAVENLHNLRRKALKMGEEVIAETQCMIQSLK